MELELLKIYTLSADGASYSAFPSASSQIEITSYAYTSSRMGTTSVSATVEWPVCLDGAWTGREFVVMNESSLSGNDTVLSLEKFFLLHRPGSAKGSDDERYVHTLEFQSERDVVLSSVYFLDAVSDQAASADRFQSNNYNVKFYGKLSEFVGRFNDVLTYMGLNSRFSVVIDAGVAATEDREVSFEKATLFEALQSVYDVWDVPFYFEGNVIHFGEGSTIVPQVSFQYGSDRELLSVEKNNTNAKIVTRCSGYGSSDNIPYYYPNPTAKGTLKAKYNNSWSTDAGSPIAITSQRRFAEGLDLNDTLTYVGAGAANKLALIDWYSRHETGTQQLPETATLTEFSPNSRVEGYPFKASCTFGLNGGYKGKVTFNLNFIGVPSAQESTENIWILENVPNPTSHNIISGRNAVEVGTTGWDMRVDNVIVTIYNPNNDQVIGQLSGVPYTAVRDAAKVYNEWYKSQQEKLHDQYYPAQKLRSVEVDFGAVLDTFKWTDVEDYPNAKVRVDCVLTLYTPYLWHYYNETSGRYMAARFDGTLTNAVSWTPGGWKYGSKSFAYNLSSLSAIGLSYTGTPAVDDVVRQAVVKYVKPSEYLMPSIYRTSDGAQRFYNAVNNTYPIPGTSPQQYYTFPNVYNSRSPREHIEEFSDIMPTVRNLVDGQGNALNVFDTVFFENGYNIKETTTDDKLKYNYFFVKLKALGFNLFDSASASGEMTFSMLDGDCGGCQFKVVVNEKQQNPVVTDANGNLVIDSTTKRVKMVEGDVVEAQQDTTSNQVWVALYLDSSTYGGTEVEMGVMPSYDANTGKGQKPVAGDKYAILNIDLPDSYILAAEAKLEQEIVKFMSENNDEKYSFNIKFSRVYLAQNPSVRALLNAHCALNLTYNGTQLAAPLHVSQYTYKANEGEALPEISVELSDIIETPSSGLEQKIAAGVKDVVNVVRGYGSDTDELDRRYARKDVDDVFMGIPTFKNGFVAGESGRMSVNASGEAILDVDYLNVSKKAVFSQIEIDRLRQVGGRVLLSMASIKCSAVEAVTSSSTVTGYKCYFRTVSNDGESITNDFVAGDFAICQSFGTTNTRYYWRKVTAVGNDYIVLSNISGQYDGTDEPLAGDEIVQLGNATDTGRQAAQILSCTGTDSPSLIAYVGISSPSLANRDIYGFKYAHTGSTYLPYLFNYGSMLLGDRAKTNDYVEYDHTNGLMTIKANVVFKASQALSGITEFDNLETAVGDLETSIDGWPTVKEALNGATAIAGGLVLTNMIQLGQKVNDVFTVKAGISGIYNANKTGGGIAGWYGGNMWDLEHLGSGETAAGAAKSLFRFDGTGYLASGKITWDANGYGQLGGSSDDYVIKWDANGIKIGKNITIGSGSDTLNTVLNHIADTGEYKLHFSQQDRNDFNSLKSILNWFGVETYTEGGVQMERIYVKKDANNNARSFYAFGEITAGGVGEGGQPGGVQYLYMLDDVPDYRGLRNKVMMVNSSGNIAWSDTPSTGVTSIIAGTGLTGGTITATGTIAIDTTYFNTNYLAASLKGVANGLAELGSDGKVPSAQLPSYVDDVLEYASRSAFPTTGESGKIYVALDTNLTYRWSGSAYVEISPSLALGETDSTAYRGDRGKIAYEHSQISGNTTIHHSHSNYATLNGITDAKVTNWDAAYIHVGSTDNPHNVTWAQVNSASGDNKIQTAYIGDGQVTLAKLAQGIQDILDLFEKDTTSVAGQTLIHAKYALYSHEEITAGGIGSGGGGGGAAIWGAITGTLSNQTDLMAALNGKASASHTHTIGNITGLQDALNAKQALITSSNKLAYSLISGTPDLSVYATTSALSAHTGDTTIHITASERSTWNGKQDAISDLSTIRTRADEGHTAYGWGNHANAGYLTTSTAASTYLPLSGGTISRNVDAPLGIVGIDSGAWIQYFAPGGTSFGYIGVTTDGPSFYDTARRVIYHSGNLSSSVIAGLGTLSNSTTGNAATSTTATNVSGGYCSLDNNETDWNFGVTQNRITPIFTFDGSATGSPGMYHYGYSFMTAYSGFQLVEYGSGNIFKIRGNFDGTWQSWHTLYHSGNCNNTSTPWSASSLTLNGMISGATSITASGQISADSLNTTGSTAIRFRNANSRYYSIEQGSSGIGLYDNTSGSVGYKMFIATSGNVGIGTTSPSYKLDVDGSARAGGFIHSSYGSSQYVLDSAGGAISLDTIYHNAETSKVYTKSFSLTVSKNWQNTGIYGGEGLTGFPSGTYAIELYDYNPNDAMWLETFAGIMYWYGSNTNDTGTDEILLHKAGHAANGRTLFLRTARTPSGYLYLQLAGDFNSTTTTNFTLRVRRIIEPI